MKSVRLAQGQASQIPTQTLDPRSIASLTSVCCLHILHLKLWYLLSLASFSLPWSPYSCPTRGKNQGVMRWPKGGKRKDQKHCSSWMAETCLTLKPNSEQSQNNRSDQRDALTTEVLSGKWHRARAHWGCLLYKIKGGNTLRTAELHADVCRWESRK